MLVAKAASDGSGHVAVVRESGELARKVSRCLPSFPHHAGDVGLGVLGIEYVADEFDLVGLLPRMR